MLCAPFVLTKVETLAGFPPGVWFSRVDPTGENAYYAVLLAPQFGQRRIFSGIAV